MAVKTNPYFIISRCSLGKLYMAGNSSHESNSYNTNGIISIKGPSSEINYKNTGQYFISSLSCCSGKHLIILRLTDCSVTYTCLSALLTRGIFSVRGKHSLTMCLAPRVFYLVQISICYYNTVTFNIFSLVVCWSLVYCCSDCCVWAREGNYCN